MNSEILIICESTYNGNTLKLGNSMANQLNCQLTDVEDAKKLDLKKYAVIGWGSGIFFARHYHKLMELAHKMESAEQKAFVFSTHGGPVLGKYHKQLNELLVSKGRTIVGEFSTRAYDCTGPFTLIGGGNKGKPNEKDQRKAAEFVKKLFPEYIAKDLYMEVYHPEPLNENKQNIYRVLNGKEEVVLAGDLVTINQNQCTGCGTCVKKCPLQVFDLIDNKSRPTREFDCVQCKLCQGYCPERAITLHWKWSDAIRVALRHKNR